MKKWVKDKKYLFIGSSAFLLLSVSLPLTVWLVDSKSNSFYFDASTDFSKYKNKVSTDSSLSKEELVEKYKHFSTNDWLIEISYGLYLKSIYSTMRQPQTGDFNAKVYNLSVKHDDGDVYLSYSATVENTYAFSVNDPVEMTLSPDTVHIHQLNDKLKFSNIVTNFAADLSEENGVCFSPADPLKTYQIYKVNKGQLIFNPNEEKYFYNLVEWAYWENISLHFHNTEITNLE